MHIRAQSTVPVCVDWSQKEDGNLGALWEVLVLGCLIPEVRGTLSQWAVSIFSALLLGMAFLLAVQQIALSLARSEAEGGSALEVCCGNGFVEVLHSSCHENFPGLIHAIATGDGGCEQQLFLLAVPLAVLPSQSLVHPTPTQDRCWETQLQGNIFGLSLILDAWLTFLGASFLEETSTSCRDSSRTPRIRGHFWKCWQRHFVLSLHFISLIPKVFHVMFYGERSLFQINHFQWDLIQF